MNKEDKIKEYYKKYQQANRKKYSEYSKNYYHKHKDRFKQYYETYKKNKIAKQNGSFEEPEKPKKSKRELIKIQWERKLQKNEERRLAFIEHLKQIGILPPDDKEEEEEDKTPDKL
jgi:hypothetical protein